MLTTEGQNSNTRRHLALDVQGHSQNKIHDFLHGTGVDDLALIFLRAGGKIAQGRDGMALDFLIFLKREKLDERVEETRFDDRRLIQRVNGDVTKAGGGGEDEREVCRGKQAEQGLQTACLDEIQLVFFY